MDYEKKLIQKIEALEKQYPVFTDYEEEVSSISVAPLPASTVIYEYYDGIQDKEYIHELTMKARIAERETAAAALVQLGRRLERVTDITSDNGSFAFGEIKVTNEMFFSEATTSGWIYLKLHIKSFLTVYPYVEEEETGNGENGENGEEEEIDKEI